MLAGTLGIGGAEKQLAYIARELAKCGVWVRVFSLTNQEWYQTWLENNGIKVTWVGQNASPIWRLFYIFKLIAEWKPHILIATHFFANIYAGVVGRILGITSVGSLRGDLHFEIENNPGWSGLLLQITDALIANSNRSRRNALAHGIHPSRLFVLPNVIDLEEFDQMAGSLNARVPFPDKTKIAIVGRLIPVKRVDRFLRWLSTIRTVDQNVTGIVIGEGSEKAGLVELARNLGLSPDGIAFLGQCENVPAVLRQCQLLALTSDHEGFPNVIIEGMASRLPIITRPVGDAPNIVLNGINGYIVSETEEAFMLKKVGELCQDPKLRRRMGDAGRRMVEDLFSVDGLSGMVFSILNEISSRRKHVKIEPFFPPHLPLTQNKETLVR